VTTYYIRDVAQLHVLCRSPRMELVEQLSRKDQTASELGRALGEPASRLYYHLNELERVGLVHVAETRTRGNLSEKVYRAVAPTIRIDPAVLTGEGSGPAALTDIVIGLLGVAADGFRRAAARQLVDEQAIPRMVHAHNELRLAPDDVTELGLRLRALVDEFIGRSRPEHPVSAALTTLMVPLLAEPRS